MSIFRVDRFTTPGPRCFTMPAGFYPDVEIHAWGAGGGSSNGANGGGGGYAKTTINMAEGDIIELCVGSAGGQATAEHGGLGGLSYIGTRFAGGHGGDKGTHFPGAGGGGASAVYVNSTTGNTETLVLVAAGGGGASTVFATKEKRHGYPGGVYSTLATTTSGDRGNSVGGGGAGAGKLGGKANPHYGGQGGQNWVSASVTASPEETLPGSGILVGGQDVIHYPAAGTGNAGYNGAVVLVLRRKMQIYNKDTGTWKRIDSLHTKIPTVLKPISKVYLPNTLTFSSQTVTAFTIPPRVTSIKIDAAGGAGGAGGGDVGGDKNNTPGGGGGASNIISSTVTVIPGKIYYITAGRGGTGGAPGGTGGTGRATTIIDSNGANILTAIGATGGSRGTNSGAGTPGSGVNGGGNGIGAAGGLSTNGGTNGGSGVAIYGSTGGVGQFGFAKITYTIPTEFVLEVIGGWKAIADVFTKVNGAWVPVTSTNIVPYKAEEMHITPGTYNWTCPEGVTRIKVKAYGAGGGGSLGGGGAGGVATAIYTVVPGQVYSYTVGAGGALTLPGGQSNFGTVIAYGGGAGGAGPGGAGGTTSITGPAIAITSATSSGLAGATGVRVYYWYGWSYWNWTSSFTAFGGYAYNRYYW